jgi:predicted ATPase
MKRFILTGTPGAGKTAILRQLELAGYGVVEEAATDVIALQQSMGIAEPHRNPGFIDDIVALQSHRRGRLVDAIQFHDRSAFCTAALADHLGYPPSEALARELELLKRESFYDKRVLFVQSLGFITPTAARRISLEAARRFEMLHESTYRLHGFELIPISPGSVLERVAAIRGVIS